MEKYNTVYVPDRNGDFKLQEFEEDYHEWRDVHSEEALSPKFNVIVLTIEELRDVWDAGWKRCAFETSENSALFPDFEPYLTSKGINIL